MDRRRFLLAGAGALAARGLAFPAAQPVRVEVDEESPLGAVPADFLGLGYEISSAERPGLLSPRNRVYAQLLRTLGPQGVLRVGGNTSDYARYIPEGAAAAKPKGTVVNRAALEALGAFCRATGWRLIWGLNLGEGTAAEAAEEAEAVSRAAGENLLAFEIGNEPDLFMHEGHRKGAYTPDDYLREYARYKAAIRARLPQAPFAGPDAAVDSTFVSRFAEAEGSDVKLLTRHYYRGQQGPASTFDLLLRPDLKLPAMLDGMREAARGRPYRICETNSFSGGGRPGVSGTFGAALWTLDFCWVLAAHGAAGINLETGFNQLGFVSSYSPVWDEDPSRPVAHPEFYGLLAFAQGAPGGRLLPARVDAGALNLTAYAARRGNGRLAVTVINKDTGGAAAVELGCKRPVRAASALRLSAPSIESTEGMMLGGAMVGADGRWSPRGQEQLTIHGGKANLFLPPASAAIVTLEA